MFFADAAIAGQKSVVNEYWAIDALTLQIPDSSTTTTTGISDYINKNFTTEKAKVRAIFFWIAANIDYDAENMFAINFYEKLEDKISKPLKSRKGICENYAALFTDICGKCGIKCYTVEGYTRQNGFSDYIPHAWSCANIDSTWFVFDPTWGSGYLDKGKYVKKINNDYFKALPSDMIASHMPFDYLWQFLNYPVSNQEFYEERTQLDRSKPFYNFRDSLLVYEKQSDIERLTASADRVEKNGVKNSLIFDRLQHLKMEIENYKQNRVVTLYNGAGVDYNNAIQSFNKFIDYRNKQFTPTKTDTQIQDLLDIPWKSLHDASDKLGQINEADAGNNAMLVKQLYGLLDDLSKRVKEQRDWLITYFSKGKSGRKSMFYDSRFTLFGIPVK
ncbi:MAG: hypothetical protein JWN78_2779 [Bacteroidota bacterium]|nr:hypothetical protein [Bacteroidota bacterium]